MEQTVACYFTSHVPGIGGAIMRGDQETPYSKPFFDGFPQDHSTACEQWQTSAVKPTL